MSRVAPVVPEESDLLCEGCGYTLNNLPTTSNCPECGKPIQQSIGGHRLPPKWESTNRGIRGFFRTTYESIFQPTRFYRSLQTRKDGNDGLVFALIHWMIASTIFAVTGILHVYMITGAGHEPWWGIWTATLPMITLGALWGTTWIAARLTRWEANYRGYRLPLNVVLRAMYYHAAHYLPVALFGFSIVLAYQVMLRTHMVDHSSDLKYLYVLCGAVVLSAIYLFNTYWIGMRNIMYANR